MQASIRSVGRGGSVKPPFLGKIIVLLHVHVVQCRMIMNAQDTPFTINNIS